MRETYHVVAPEHVEVGTCEALGRQVTPLRILIDLAQSGPPKNRLQFVGWGELRPKEKIYETTIPGS